jgi:NADPH:quinone reductase-like Zn-dependent oxidoreductase
VEFTLAANRQTIQVQPHPEALTDMAKLLAAGSLSTRVGQVVPLAEARSAYEQAKAGTRGGKVVLAMTQ